MCTGKGLLTVSIFPFSVSILPAKNRKMAPCNKHRGGKKAFNNFMSTIQFRSWLFNNKLLNRYKRQTKLGFILLLGSEPGKAWAVFLPPQCFLSLFLNGVKDMQLMTKKGAVLPSYGQWLSSYREVVCTCKYRTLFCTTFDKIRRGIMGLLTQSHYKCRQKSGVCNMLYVCIILSL